VSIGRRHERKSIAEVVETIWGTKGGAKFSERSVEVIQVVAENFREDR